MKEKEKEKKQTVHIEKSKAKNHLVRCEINPLRQQNSEISFVYHTETHIMRLLNLNFQILWLRLCICKPKR